MRFFDLMQGAAKGHKMTDAVWERHLNPWSGATRFPILPLMALAIWSRAWIGLWCLVPLGLLIVWTWINPRAFPPPQHTDTWYGKAVLGERAMLNHGEVPIPAHHMRALEILSLSSALGLPMLGWGLWAYDLGFVIAGLVTVILFKTWFLDRMAWLFDDMARAHPPYRAWLR